MKHEDFREQLRDAALGEALDAIEGRILPSLTMLIEAAAGAAPGTDAASHAADLAALARELDTLGAAFGQSVPTSTDAK